MRNEVIPYAATVYAMGAGGALVLIQLMVADVAGVRAKHVPGAPVAADHASFLFRAVRAHANTNESIAAFILLSLFGMLNAAPPAWVNGGAWVYVAARAAHMILYYAGMQIPRSIAFGVSIAALVAMLVAGVLAI